MCHGDFMTKRLWHEGMWSTGRSIESTARLHRTTRLQGHHVNFVHNYSQDLMLQRTCKPMNEGRSILHFGSCSTRSLSPSRPLLFKHAHIFGNNVELSIAIILSGFVLQVEPSQAVSHRFFNELLLNEAFDVQIQSCNSSRCGLSNESTHEFV
jgi:hypothetical protein